MAGGAVTATRSDVADASRNMNTPPWLDELALFLGAASVPAARCYARCPRPPEGRDWRLEGSVRGPFSTRARTLPATTTWTDLGPGPTLMATASIPDPCYWTPDNPALYDVQLRVLDGTREIAATRRMLGLRRLGAHGRAFRFEAQRWVLRGVTRFAPPPSLTEPAAHGGPTIGSEPVAASTVFSSTKADHDIAMAAWDTVPWRDENATLVARDLSDSECDRAQSAGRLLAAWVPMDRGDWAAELRRLSRSAAVAFAILEGGAAAGLAADAVRSLAPNLCLLQAFAADARVTPSDWAQGVVVEAGDDRSAFARRIAACGLPVVAYRPFAPRVEQVAAWRGAASAACEANTSHDPARTWAAQAFAAARGAVDALQRDLAPVGDYAGYIV